MNYLSSHPQQAYLRIARLRLMLALAAIALTLLLHVASTPPTASSTAIVAAAQLP